jgi:hypothetical protein
MLAARTLVCLEPILVAQRATASTSFAASGPRILR